MTKPTVKVPTKAHVTGVIVEHETGGNTTSTSTIIRADVVHGKIRLNLKQGSAELKIWASDWDFFKDRIEEQLGKKRLISAQ